MASVTITLSDDKGSVAVSVNYVDGYNKFSNAHQVSRIVVQQMDELMTKQQEVIDAASEVVGAPV